MSLRRCGHALWLGGNKVQRTSRIALGLAREPRMYTVWRELLKQLDDREQC
jgi:hypothetical protein